MDSGRHKPLMLVSAPAGYGKSILVSCWLEHQGGPRAWLSLEKDDDTPRRFLAYFLAAVANIFPDAVPRTTTMVNHLDMPPIRELGSSLINELDRIDEDYILVLDDVHHFRHRSIFELLNGLLQHPPAHLHLVLIGRRDPFLPISAMRAQSLITEIRTLDLRFTPEETARFLNQELGRRRWASPSPPPGPRRPKAGAPACAWRPWPCVIGGKTACRRACRTVCNSSCSISSKRCWPTSLWRHVTC
jgi:LuxR family maltose regulon positive regulatory protein